MTPSPADLDHLRAMLASTTRTTPHALPDPSPALIAAGLVEQRGRAEFARLMGRAAPAREG